MADIDLALREHSMDPKCTHSLCNALEPQEYKLVKNMDITASYTEQQTKAQRDYILQKARHSKHEADIIQGEWKSIGWEDVPAEVLHMAFAITFSTQITTCSLPSDLGGTLCRARQTW